MKKIQNKKGFTLAELLIVMAIILILAAIAIPNFTKQLEASRETSDLNAIRAAGLSLPKDISVMGYDGINLAQVISPKLTTWQQNTEEIGRIVAARLIERIENPRTTAAEYIVVQGKLFEGQTVQDIN